MFRGEVWKMTMERVPRNQEQDTSHERKVVILSSDSLSSLPLRIVVPLIPWKEVYSTAPWMVRVPPVLNSGLEIVMVADALQVRSISTARLINRLGDLPYRLVDEIASAVAAALEVPDDE